MAAGIIFFIFHHSQRWCDHTKSMINIQPWNSSAMMLSGLPWELFVHLYLKYHIFICHRIRNWVAFCQIWYHLYLWIVPITKIISKVNLRKVLFGQLENTTSNNRSYLDIFWNSYPWASWLLPSSLVSSLENFVVTRLWPNFI